MKTAELVEKMSPSQVWDLLTEVSKIQLAGPWVEFTNYSWKRFPSPKPYSTQCCEVYRNTAEDEPETWYASSPNVSFRKPFTNAEDAKAHVDAKMSEAGWSLA